MDITDSKEMTRREFLTWLAVGATVFALPGGLARAAAPTWAFADLDLPVVDMSATSNLVIPDPPPPIINPPGVVTPAGAPAPRRMRLSATRSTAPGAVAPQPMPAAPAPSAPYNHGAYAQYAAPSPQAGYDAQSVPAAYQQPYQMEEYQKVSVSVRQPQRSGASAPRLSAARATPSEVTVVPAPAVSAPGGKVQALSRKMWANVQANPAKMRPMGQVKRITIHHEGSEKPNNDTMPFDVVETLRIIHGQHRKRMGAGDIGYHFIIDRTGLIWQGRDWSYQGAHTSGANANNLGVMLLGNFEVQRPTQQQLDSLNRLVASLVRKFDLTPSRDIYGHGDLCKTQCPGSNLRPQVDVLRRM